MTPFEKASIALAESLLDDPFYWAISEDSGSSRDRRKATLRNYFVYSLEEARRTGHCVLARDPALGAAAWILPRTPEVAAAESAAKKSALASILGPRGMKNYLHMVDFMVPRAEQVIPPGAWYLSIIGVHPSAQGRGLGAQLLTGTLAQASSSRVPCFLETFSPRSVPFYQRFGFRPVASHLEPTTNHEYSVLLREK